MKMYRAPGMRPKARGLNEPRDESGAGWIATANLRPVYNSNVTSEPFSASKRSSRGVKARTLSIMWMKPMCSNG